MDDILKYTRLVFEVRYLNNTSDFECIIELVEEGFTRCICIPGVAANYILLVLKNTFKEFEGTADIVWKDECKRYVAECKNEKNERWYCNFVNEYQNSNSEEICLDRNKINSEELEDAKFAYIRIRGKKAIKEKYNINKLPYRLEKCLLFSQELESNAQSVVNLFSYIANEYRTEWKMEKYLDVLFRLYFFLFPENVLWIIKEHYYKNNGNNAFLLYNKKVLEDYYSMAIDFSKLDDDSKDVLYRKIDLLETFLGINFKMVFQYYATAKECGDIKYVIEVIQTRLNKAKNVIESIKEIKDYFESYSSKSDERENEKFFESLK